ncbi:conjugal transfer protein TraA, partial [Sinorhizobium meliloti]|nr:conjugal transfer protein TraA [Sinorhizobium meliloti]
ERSVSADDRADFDEIAGLARDFVNQKRELVDLYQQRKQALAEQGGESLRSEPRDPANDEWDAAGAKHGEAVVVAGNEAMIQIEHYREGLARIEAGEFSADRKEGMQAGLNQALERAAQLAVEGNSYIREVAEQDPGLQRAIEQEENKYEEVKDKAPSNAETVDEQQRDLRAEEADRQPIAYDARAAHELASTVDATNRLQDRLNKDREAAQRGGETTRTDPAQQHIPRLEELEREQTEQRERERDDRDR